MTEQELNDIIQKHWILPIDPLDQFPKIQAHHHHLEISEGEGGKHREVFNKLVKYTASMRDCIDGMRPVRIVMDVDYEI